MNVGETHPDDPNLELCEECQGVGSVCGEFCEDCDGMGWVDILPDDPRYVPEE